MLNYRFHRKASHDFNKAIEWYDSHGEELANRFCSEVDNAIKRIQQQPDTFPAYLEFPNRYCPVTDFPYILVFKVEPAYIKILAVHHTSRDDEYIMSRF